MYYRAGWIFIASPHTVTPFHIDRNHGILLQIHGTKKVYVWDAEDAQVCYESSHRILKLLGELSEEYPEARVWIARELTKQFEEVLEGSPAELAELLTATPEKQKGEFVVVVTRP